MKGRIFYERDVLMDAMEKEGYLSGSMEAFLDEVATADVMPVVRCVECKHYRTGICVVKRYRDDDSIIEMPPDAYCSYGERKKGQWQK